jgi:AMP-binding enzyme
MILDDGKRETGGDRTTLDDLFRRAGVRHTQAIALIDPPHCESITSSAPQRLTFAQADRAISALAARLRGLGLQTDTVVAVQLANNVAGIVTLLGILRAGMIAAPLPLLWRKQEMVAALSRIGAKAIVTSARIGTHAHAETAMKAAAELFPVRYVCGFGPDLPDGVVPFNDCLAPGALDFVQPSARPGNAGDHVAIVTFDITADGLLPVARNHRELIAGGRAAFLEAGIAEDENVLSMIPPGSFAGIALTLLPWLLSGGALTLHHGFDAEAFTEHCRAHDGALVVPGPALTPLADAGLLQGIKTILALWRAPERLATAAPWQGEAALVDIASFGEIGLLSARRYDSAGPAPIPHGAVGAALETARNKAGMLALRGAMVPTHAFPPGAEHGIEPHVAPDKQGFVDTGYPCRRDRVTDTLAVTGPPSGITAIGGYRFRQRDVDMAVARLDAAATIVALPEALLGQRLAGGAPDRNAIVSELQAQGANPLIVAAFCPKAA